MPILWAAQNQGWLPVQPNPTSQSYLKSLDIFFSCYLFVQFLSLNFVDDHVVWKCQRWDTLDSNSSGVSKDHDSCEGHSYGTSGS